MKYIYTDLENCHTSQGTVVVIDVLRAFSNAAYAFSRGAKRIIPVSTVEEALNLKKDTPGALAIGEVGGLPPKGFDFGNSPTQTKDLDLTDKTIIQRTGAGTQGIVRCTNADTILAASFVVVTATAKQIIKLNIDKVTFVITGQYAPGHGDEDLACGEYLETLLKGKKPDPGPFIERVYKSKDAIQHIDPSEIDFPFSDLQLCTDIDAFDFAMPVLKEKDRVYLTAVQTK